MYFFSALSSVLLIDYSNPLPLVIKIMGEDGLFLFLATTGGSLPLVRLQKAKELRYLWMLSSLLFYLSFFAYNFKSLVTIGSNRPGLTQN